MSKATLKKSPAKKVEFSWEFMGNLFVKAGTNEILRKALKKIANMNENSLVTPRLVISTKK